MRHLIVAWFLAHVGHQKRLTGLCDPANNAALPHLETQRLPTVDLPVGANPCAHHYLVFLDQADADQVVSEDVPHPPGDFAQQLLNVQDGNDVLTNLVDQTKLLRLPSLKFQGPRFSSTRVIRASV